MEQGKWASLLMTFVMTVSLASCGVPSAQTTLPPETFVPMETKQPVEGNCPVTVQVHDENGTSYAEAFERALERVAYNQPQAIQLLLALGLGDRIVGTCRSVKDVNEKYRDELEALPFIVGNDSPPKEMALDTKPDLITGWGSTFTKDTLGSVQDWNERGIATYITDSSAPGVEGRRTVSRLYNDIEKLGEIFGIEDKAQAMISDMKTRGQTIADKVSALEDTDKITVLIVQMVYEDEFFGRRDTGLTYDLIEKAGSTCLDEAFGKRNVENLITLSPDTPVIISRTDSSAQEKIDALKSNPSLSEANAVKSDRFVPLDHVDFYGGNYETIDAIGSLACGFHPELFSERPEEVVTWKRD